MRSLLKSSRFLVMDYAEVFHEERFPFDALSFPLTPRFRPRLHRRRVRGGRFAGLYQPRGCRGERPDPYRAHRDGGDAVRII